MNEKEQRLGLAYLLFELFCLPTLLAIVNSLLDTPLSEAVINLIYFVLNFTCILAIFWRFLRTSLHLALERPVQILKYAFLGFVFYQLSSYVVNMGIILMMPDFTNVNDNAIFQMSGEHFALVAAGLVLLVPVVEETLFRGLVFRELYQKNKLWGYLLSALIFASIHVLGYLGHYDLPLLAMCFIQYLPAGLCLAWAYVKADNIFAPILLHITINQIGVAAMR